MDGATFLLPKGKREVFDKICKEWNQKTNLILEEKQYKKMNILNVSNYWALDEDDEVKKKGKEALTDFELFKNKSERVVKLALEQYFIYGKDPVEFIKNYKNIYDFCIMAKANKGLWLEMQKGEEIIKLNKIVRYYISTDSEWELYKRGIGSTGKNVNAQQRAPTELGKQYIKYFNQYEELEDYKIDYHPYIIKALSVIDNLEKSKKKQAYINNNKSASQISMF